MTLPESYYYNAIATHCNGEYAAVKRARGNHASWRAAWESTGAAQQTDAAASWAALAKNGVTLILNESPEFPALLREIPHPPFGLYVKGALPEQDPYVAIVGTRKASANGIRIARQFAETLAGHGACIASGLAFGVDAAAHAGALDAGGATVAVLACGLDTVYPAQHASLAERIVTNGGALISEYPFKSETLPYRFLERNRIVSGLSRGILLVEAPERSGSLATAKFALEQNRDVFVVPGPIHDEHYAGSHALIKAGAALVTAPLDICDALGIAVPQRKENGRAGALQLSAEEQQVYDALKSAGTALTVDKIAQAATLPSHVVNRNLTLLQLKGIIRESGGYYELISL